MGQVPSRGCGGSPLPESPRGILQPAAPGPSAGPEAGPGDMLCDIMRGSGHGTARPWRPGDLVRGVAG